MSNTSELLLKLQGLDYQLGELERSKDYLPDMIDNLEGEIKAAKQGLDEASDQLEATKLEHKRLELRVKEKTTDLERLKSQMTQIKTNKEYDALSREIDSTRQEIASAEDGILEALEAIEQLNTDLEEKTKALEELKETNGQQLSNIKAEIDSVGDKIKIKQGERENILVRLDKPLVAVYERVRRGKGAGAVVAVRHRACSGCFKTLPPQLIQEIRRGERVITCDSCGRILIWDGDSADE
jgi:predicted  nucleic acid-binding Zn-ribbon protein